MKTYVLIITILISSFSFSLDSIKSRKVEKPTITHKVYLGEALLIGTFKIEFIEVLQESRCPNGVTCIREGEVVVLVDLYEDGEKIKSKQITVNSKSIFQKRNLYASGKFTVSVLNVLPYPDANFKTETNNYYLLLATES
ncbi:hypothetical protein [uncultured Algibacter sp.]|uniref:hypothetical protein n=1 Tax=uncultured Algibacter sp. TaxID=298659 RepID=UPI0026397375|nr:hypothetical protein [uncultured Algibacter sp.]